MKRILYGSLVVAAVLLLPLAARAQQLVQQAPQQLDACSSINATAAVNNTATVTLTPPNGQYVYICGIDITVSADATGAVAQTNVAFTSTNLGGWQVKYSTVSTLNTNVFVYQSPPGFLIKSAQPGVAVTIVSPAINLHNAYSINAYYYYAP